MRLEKTTNASKSIVYGIILKIIQIGLPFAMRTLMIYYIGVEYLGLNSLCTNLLSFLNLAELGVGSAMVYCMYRPIAENDTGTIRALMALYRLCYRIIGIVILFGGVIVSIFLRQIIKGDIPKDVNIYIVYYLNLASTVLTYWLFGYKNSILTAYQKEDIKSKVDIVCSLIQYIIQIVAIVKFSSFYLYLIAGIVIVPIKNIATAMVANKLYPDYYCDGMVEREQRREIFGQVKDLFTAKLGGVVINSADSIVISAFLGLTALAIYNNYYYIISSLVGFMAIIFNAIRAGIGNSIILDSKKTIYSTFKGINFIISWLIGVCTCSLFCLYQPFMKLWVGEDLMYDNTVVVLMCIYFYVWKSLDLLNTYKDAAGLWHKDRFRPLISSIFNLIVNLALVRYIGIYGVIISTILSHMIVSGPWLVANTFSGVFQVKPWEFLKDWVIYIIVTILASFITYELCDLISKNGFLAFIVRVAICCVVPNIIFLAVFFRKKEFAFAINKAKTIMMKK